MNRERISSRQQACYALGIREDANQDEIKKAYHLMVKRYHPDVNPDDNTRENYIRIQNAYDYLLHNPYSEIKYQYNVDKQSISNIVNKTSRPVRIFQTDVQVKEMYRRQKQLEEERKRVQKREKEIKHQQQQNIQKSMTNKQAINKEEEVLQKIRAIWLAETVRRQIALDKEKKDAENKRKLYQAFMQHKMLEEESQ